MCEEMKQAMQKIIWTVRETFPESRVDVKVECRNERTYTSAERRITESWSVVGWADNECDCASACASAPDGLAEKFIHAVKVAKEVSRLKKQAEENLAMSVT